MLPLRSLSGSWRTIQGQGSAGIVFRRIPSTWSTRQRKQASLWGLAYKGGVKDTRRSPSVDLLRSFQRFGVKAIIFDPFVGTVKVGSVRYASAGSMLDSVKGADAVVIATNHAEFRQVDL